MFRARLPARVSPRSRFSVAPRRIPAAWWSVVLVALALAGPAARAAPRATAIAQVAVLYDGARGTTPDAQGFVFLASPPLLAVARQEYAGGATTLDSAAARRDAAGYFVRESAVPTLDRTAGYTVSLTLQILAENHDGSARGGDAWDDRAGFSLIVLSSDRRGVELGFWQDRVWAQADGRDAAQPIFTQAEGAAFDTTAALTTYELHVLGDSYALLAGGAPLLSGPLRDYTGFEPEPLQPDPYETPNLVFLGDDTGAAYVRARVAGVAASTAVPQHAGGQAIALPFVTH